MAKAKKKAVVKKAVRKAKTVARKAAKAAPKKSARKVAKKAPKKVARKSVVKAAKKSAPKAKAKASKAVAKKAVAPAKAAARPMKSGVGGRPASRDESAGIRIAPTQPERVTHAPKPQSAPLKMPFAVPLEHPIAPLELRPAPLFERELFAPDDEE